MGKIYWTSQKTIRVDWPLPDHDAEVVFELEGGRKVGFRIAALSDGTEYLERINYDQDPEIVDRRVGEPNRRSPR
jgi:hypothetical protein